MRLRTFSAVVTIGGLILLSACGTRPRGTGGGAGSGGDTAPITLAITDTPPSGVTILSFTITVSSATLQPGNVELIGAPVTVNVAQLQTDFRILGTADVAPGDYTGVDFTFANPNLTIYNQGGTFTNCANGAICQIQASLPTTSQTLQLPLTVAVGSPQALELEFNANNVLQSNLSVDITASNGLTLTSFSNVATGSQLLTLDAVPGVITSLGSNQFTMTTLNGLSVTATTNNSTTYTYPSATCSKENFSCLATGQLVSVDLSVFGDGSYQATSVILDSATTTAPGISGTIAAIAATSPPQFTLVIDGQDPTTTGVDIGNVATVTIENDATYAIDADGLTIPSGLTFASASGLVVGQEVLVQGNTVQVTTESSGPNTIAISTSQIVLRQSQWTATVGTINSGNGSFTLVTLPSLFTYLSPTSIQSFDVDTTAQTQFSSLNEDSISGLSAGTQVSVKGLVFNTVISLGAPSIVASEVVGPTTQQQTDARRARRASSGVR